MHLPRNFQFLYIGTEPRVFEDMLAASEYFYNDYGIKIRIKTVTFSECVNLLENTTEVEYCIMYCCQKEHNVERALSYFSKEFNVKPHLNHKVVLVDPFGEDPRKQMYMSIVSSLNLSMVISTDGIIKTFSILLNTAPTIKTYLLPLAFENKVIEISNIKPVVLESLRFETLFPAFYFVARDFASCICHIRLPNESTWLTAYLIQCDDSGMDDFDMVKVCIIPDLKAPSQPIPKTKPSTSITSQSQSHANNSYTAPIPLPLKEPSVLNNQAYPLCRNLKAMLDVIEDINSLKNQTFYDQFISLLEEIIKHCYNVDSEVFPDVSNIWEVKSKYLKLFKEVSSALTRINNRVATTLPEIKREYSRGINSLVKELNITNASVAMAEKRHKPIYAPSSISQSQHHHPSSTPHTLSLSISYSSPDKRIREDSSSSSHRNNKSLKSSITSSRRNSQDHQQPQQREEGGGGFISMPLLEPYLEIKWPKFPPPVPLDKSCDPILKACARERRHNEIDLLLQKRFGV